MSALAAFRRAAIAAAAFTVLAAPPAAHAALTVTLINMNDPGVGLNDPTPVAPVGGNTGTTLGAQRQIALLHAASLWAATLTSAVTATIQVSFVPLDCNATGAVLASAGSLFVVQNFPNAPRANTWFPAVLGNKLAGVDLIGGQPQMRARFNINLGQPTCLANSPFYLGLDNNVPAGLINIITTALHEFGHAFGFQNFTSGSTGVPFQGVLSNYDYFIVDNTQNLTWAQMTDAQRMASAVNFRKVAWNGAGVTNAAANVLTPGVTELSIAGSTPATGVYEVGGANFGPPLTPTGVTADIMPLSAANPLGCNPLAGNDALAVNGNIALIDRGTCAFVVKVKNAQNAGAVGVVIANNAAGSPPTLGGADPTIVIPTLSVSQADGAAIKAALQTRSRTQSGAIGTMRVNTSRRAGTDPLGRVLLYTPNPFASGSSVSHWDTSAVPNLLMEPNITSDLTQSVIPPQDLTFPHLQDLGW